MKTVPLRDHPVQDPGYWALMLQRAEEFAGEAAANDENAQSASPDLSFVIEGDAGGLDEPIGLFDDWNATLATESRASLSDQDLQARYKTIEGKQWRTPEEHLFMLQIEVDRQCDATGGEAPEKRSGRAPLQFGLNVASTLQDITALQERLNAVARVANSVRSHAQDAALPADQPRDPREGSPMHLTPEQIIEAAREDALQLRALTDASDRHHRAVDMAHAARDNPAYADALRTVDADVFEQIEQAYALDWQAQVDKEDRKAAARESAAPADDWSDCAFAPAM